MPPTYEFWLLDDSGRRISLLQDFAFFSYSRTVTGFATLQIGFPYREYKERIDPVFQPDWRVDVWRSADIGIPLRRENTYLLRLYKIYTRESDNLDMIVLYGHGPRDLLRRRYIIQPAGYDETRKTNYIDDMMKEIVKEQMLFGTVVDETGVQDNARAFPDGEFLVRGNESLGPYLTYTFADRNVLDILKELQKATQQLYDEDPLIYTRIYFDVLPFDVQGNLIYILDEESESGDPILDELGDPILDEESYDTTAEQGFEFLTFAGLRGQDRTDSGLVFSVENNNLSRPYFTHNYMEEENSIVVKGFGRGDSRITERVEDTQRVGASRWNLIEGYEDGSTEPDQDFIADLGYARLYEERPKEEISAIFLNTPGSEDTPRSLYGVDWDLGDLLPVEYANRRFNVDVNIVYVSLDEKGKETITGRNGISGGN